VKRSAAWPASGLRQQERGEADDADDEQGGDG
jgi:hypothetical protein